MQFRGSRPNENALKNWHRSKQENHSVIAFLKHGLHGKDFCRCGPQPTMTKINRAITATKGNHTSFEIWQAF